MLNMLSQYVTLIQLMRLELLVFAIFVYNILEFIHEKIKELNTSYVLEEPLT